MRGLMSGCGLVTQGSCTIPLSLMAVVQNALSYAWRELLVQVANEQFSICDSDEDTITERLCLILGALHAAEPEAIEGLSAMFETPVREGNLRNQQGDRLDCQPDLTFRPLKGHLMTTNSLLTGIFVECKPIDSRHPIGGKYCKEGVSRFIRSDYAWSVDRAIMLAYVRNICQLPDGLNYVLDQEPAKKSYRIKQALTPLAQTKEGDAIYYTIHDRENPGLSPHKGSTYITLHHLWLRPDEPCETSRCKA